MDKKIIVGITGGSGAIYGVRLLEALNEAGVETHLIISEWGEKTIQMETSYTLPEVKKMAAVSYSVKNQAAAISSGSFRVDGMVIAPCSMKTLAGIATGLASDLIARAADVMLKERKKLILLTRESPLNLVHVRNMETVILAGAMVFPPVPAFYNQPKSIDDIVNHTVGRVLDQLDLDPDWVNRWGKQ
ncbi:UbiX family flavin prenyltransferase [Brevibacillus humidisoli]|uniref:UbiX family flavin prenyltransferase n=1 Tax=Brevibacillus humidisoli TaxID=2895522 RepID=UPI001E4C8BB3|nr:UbiX family flavin prenyltransferase [Brevibacillus humidisoli]UFJ42003.1 UbiX family flavin prenyltransferase [Brevibacillus humidisoli]